MSELPPMTRPFECGRRLLQMPRRKVVGEDTTAGPSPLHLLFSPWC
jgi:hypothetical protein